MKFLRTVSIKYKIRGAFIIIIMLSALGGLLSFYLLSKVAGYQHTKHLIANLVLSLSEARKAEKDFIAHGYKSLSFQKQKESDFLRVYERKMDEIHHTLTLVKQDPYVFELKLNLEIDYISHRIASYGYTFKNLVALLHERGFKDHGLEGEMRVYVHGLQNCISPEEQVFAYSLRRHEKDFTIRKDLKYSKQLYATMGEFVEFVKNSSMPHMTPTYKERIIHAILAYKNHFLKIESIEKEIGLSEKEGLQGELNRMAEEIEPKVRNIYQIINSKSDKLYADSKKILFTSLVLLLISGVYFTFYLTRNISKPVIDLDEATQEIVNTGQFNISEKLLQNVVLKDEIGSLVDNFRRMVMKMQEQWRTIEEKNERLENILAKEEERKWAIHGFNYFNDLIKVNNKELRELSTDIIKQLINYTKSNLGSIFLLEERDGNIIMKQKACYAYERQKKATAEFEPGEGLVGQCWRDGDFIFMTDIPQNYIRITSGLGSANPKALLIVPILFEDKVLGIIELASFYEYQPYEIEFVQQLAEKLGSTFFNLLPKNLLYQSGRKEPALFHTF